MMTSRLTAALAILATSAALGLSACGSDDTEFEADKNPLPAKAPQTSPTAPAGGNGGEASGEQLFSQNCTVCHGQRGAGGHQGPNLQTSNNTDNRGHVESRIRNGKGSMPAFGDQLSDEEVSALVNYVVDELHGG